jgi:hypothetical protein
LLINFKKIKIKDFLSKIKNFDKSHMGGHSKKGKKVHKIETLFFKFIKSISPKQNNNNNYVSTQPIKEGC